MSTREDAREVLDAQVSDEELAEAAAAGAGYVRHGVGTVRPYLYGNLDLIKFVQEVFGAVELERSEFGPRSFHVEAAIGDSVVVLEVSDPPHASAAPASVYVYVPDVDAAYGRALEAGAQEIAPPEDKPYDERAAGVKDSFGNTWWIATYQAPALWTVVPAGPAAGVLPDPDHYYAVGGDFGGVFGCRSCRGRRASTGRALCARR